MSRWNYPIPSYRWVIQENLIPDDQICDSVIELLWLLKRDKTEFYELRDNTEYVEGYDRFTGCFGVLLAALNSQWDQIDEPASALECLVSDFLSSAGFSQELAGAVAGAGWSVYSGPGAPNKKFEAELRNLAVAALSELADEGVVSV